jgi:hypothetical protein
MMTTDLHTRTTGSENGRPPEIRPSTTKRGSSFRVEESLLPLSAVVIESFDIGSFELVRRFVEHVEARNELAWLGNGERARRIIDWAAVEVSVADSRNLELAIGRAVVLADQMSRGVLTDAPSEESPSSLRTEEAFFAFSMAGVTPDFGDESRYRTRLARRVTKVLPTRRRIAAVPATAAVPAAAAPFGTSPTEPTISAS